MLPGVLALVRAAVELAEAEVAVGDEGAHAEFIAEGSSVPIVHLGLYEGVALRGDGSQDVQRKRFVRPLPVRTRELEGRGVRQDVKAAIALLQDASDGRDRDWRGHAYHQLGHLHETGAPPDLQRDRKAAARYYARAAAEGSQASKTGLERLTQYPEVFVSLNEREFRADARSLAPAGMAAAYEAFKAADHTRAYPIFLWHARNGNAEAQAAMATYHKEGLHISPDGHHQAAWTYLAAYNGNRRAQLELGLLYRKSNLVPVDDDEAEQWFRAAANQGLADATNELGVLALYPFHEGRKPNPEKAFRYFSEVAQAGSTFALANLGDAYFNGMGVARDRDRAKEYFLAATRRGNVVARQRLLEHFNIAYGTEPIGKGEQPGEAAPESRSIVAAVAVPSTKPEPPLTPVELFSAVSKSVIRLFALNLQNAKDASQGSAVAVTSRIAITNCHVLEGKNAYGSKTAAGVTLFRRIAGDDSRDVCLIKSDRDLVAATTTRKYADLRIGERVYAIGSPQGLENTLSEGLVSGLRTMDGTRYIQITAPITHGSSGGGLFDERGRLIGITTLGAKTGNLNFAVAIDEALLFLAKVK
jgi:TPR repeat protein